MFLSLLSMRWKHVDVFYFPRRVQVWWSLVGLHHGWCWVSYFYRTFPHQGHNRDRWQFLQQVVWQKSDWDRMNLFISVNLWCQSFGISIFLLTVIVVWKFPTRCQPMCIFHMTCLYNFPGLLSAVICYIICCLLRLGDKSVWVCFVFSVSCRNHDSVLNMFVYICSVYTVQARCEDVTVLCL